MPSQATPFSSGLPDASNENDRPQLRETACFDRMRRRLLGPPARLAANYGDGQSLPVLGEESASTRHERNRTAVPPAVSRSSLLEPRTIPRPSSSASAPEPGAGVLARAPRPQRRRG